MSDGWRRSWGNVVDAIRGTLADALEAGSMSAADFLKLAGLPASAVPTSRTVGTTAPLAGGGDLSADRTLSIVPASAIVPGSMSAADFAKLSGLPSSAVPTTRNVGTTAPLTGGGDLSADRTLAISPASAIAAGSMAAADFAKLVGVPAGGSIAIALRSASINLLSAATINIPVANPGGGLLFYATALRVDIDSQTGTAATVAMNYDILANGGTWLASASAVASATVNNASPRPVTLNLLSNVPGGIDPNIANCLQIKINTPWSGGTLSAAQGRFTMLGFYA